MSEQALMDDEIDKHPEKPEGKPPVDIDKIISQFDEQSGTQSIGSQQEQVILTPDSLADMIRFVTAYVGRMANEPELELNDYETDLLKKGLMPFAKNLDTLLKMMPYLPLAMFGVAYGLRVTGVLKRRRDAKMNPPKPTAEKEPADSPKETEDAKDNSTSKNQ